VDVRQQNPQARVLLDNLPGFPDNLMRGERRQTSGLASPRPGMRLLDSLSAKPFWRKFIVRLPEILHPPRIGYGHIVAFTEDGDIVRDLQDPSGSFPKTTGVTEHAGRLYLHTLNDHGLAWVSE
jgi:hypothetical protein